MAFLRTLLALVICLALSGPTVAQSPSPQLPESLLGFFEPGMTIVVSSTESGLLVSVYDEQTSRILRESRELDFAALARKYPSVQEEAEKQIQEFKERNPSRKEEAAESEPDVGIYLPRGASIYTVSHIGSDYLLVRSSPDSGWKEAISSRSIFKIVFSQDRLPMWVSQGRRR